MKIAIIGAGWYGCHLAISLIQKDYKVQIFERSASSISGASRYNQNRLHQGFHYPRDFETRKQSHEGFDWFIEHYSSLVESVPNNIYAIANKTSNLDFETYKQIMKASGLEFEDVSDDPSFSRFTSIQGLVSTTEKHILNHRASHYFDNILSNCIEFNHEIDLSNDEKVMQLKREYDYVIDCTWGTARKTPDLDYYYEPCIYFYYKKKTKEDFAFTLMDGNFFSIYPYDNDIFTVTSVANTPIGQTTERSEITTLFQQAKKANYVDNKRITFETEILYYYPQFLSDFEFVEPVYSLKSKIVSSSDFRGCIVKQEDNLISVFSGKIDTLHIAETEVMKIIEYGNVK
jgi:hypothetical protein